ncbi:DNA polymerase III subunit delta [Spiroplasma culicicola]|uniref:DNA polymerase III subunit delta n=1 Tax=Spiroplasma culicicola AES-1 TaxID=1276246 RepID=W6A7G7_9MOLU|nr:DNA polymerase III subunit delta [Spiroplasma culicicola]AHI52926.1 DNA polymerase III subunit delta [Spiroplasma culicicola AES-1]
MFFVHSADQFLIRKQVNKLIDKINVAQDHEVFSFSFIDNSINEIFEEINTYSLFSVKKIIVINDCWFVNEAKIKLHKDFDNKYIEKIIANQNTDISIIFTLNSDKFSKKLKIAKLIEANTKVLKIDMPTFEQKQQLIIKKLQNNEIDYDLEGVNYFIDVILDDMNVFENELNKLINLKQKVTVELIKQNIINYLQYDVFEITNSFLKKDLATFLKQWRNYIEINSNIFSFLALLANQFITLRNILLLKNMNFNNYDIASRLSQNPYRVQKLLQENTLNVSEINDKIKSLYTLERNIKLGKVDAKVIPEYEFIKMFN